MMLTISIKTGGGQHLYLKCVVVVKAVRFSNKCGVLTLLKANQLWNRLLQTTGTRHHVHFSEMRA